MATVDYTPVLAGQVVEQPPPYGAGCGFAAVGQTYQQNLTYSAAITSYTTVRVYFAAALAALAATSLAARYTITGPSAISVGSVAFTPGNAFVDLTVSGSWVAGTYTLAIAANTAVDAFGNYNSGSAPIVYAPTGGDAIFNGSFA